MTKIVYVIYVWLLVFSQAEPTHNPGIMAHPIHSVSAVLERVGEIFLGGMGELAKKSEFMHVNCRRFMNSVMHVFAATYERYGPPTETMIAMAQKVGERTKNDCSKYGNECLHLQGAISVQTRTAVAFGILYKRLFDYKTRLAAADSGTIGMFASYEVCQTFPTFVLLMQKFHAAGVLVSTMLDIWLDHYTLCDDADAYEMTWRPFNLPASALPGGVDVKIVDAKAEVVDAEAEAD